MRRVISSECGEDGVSGGAQISFESRKRIRWTFLKSERIVF